MANNPNHNISGEARNAMIAAIGIILGFILGYFGTWGAADEPWTWWDTIPGAFLAAGIGMLLISLHRSLIPYSQPVRRYERNAKLFVYGTFAAFVGVVLSLFI